MGIPERFEQVYRLAVEEVEHEDTTPDATEDLTDTTDWLTENPRDERDHPMPIQQTLVPLQKKNNTSFPPQETDDENQETYYVDL